MTSSTVYKEYENKQRILNYLILTWLRILHAKQHETYFWAKARVCARHVKIASHIHLVEGRNSLAVYRERIEIYMRPLFRFLEDRWMFYCI